MSIVVLGKVDKENYSYENVTCMYSLVNFEIFRPSKYFATSREGAGERFLSGVDPQVVHQLVLCLERPLLPRALLPVAGMVYYQLLCFCGHNPYISDKFTEFSF